MPRLPLRPRPRNRDSIDDARILPRFRGRKPEAPTKRVSGTAPASGDPTHIAKAPGDPFALRGFPIVSHEGLGGVIPGTQPEQALLAKQPSED